ncbi:8586_t:CDS:2, partial [Gigaspora margarita]
SATQAYRENIASQNKLQEAIKDGDIELKQSDIQPDLIKEKYLKADQNTIVLSRKNLAYLFNKGVKTKNKYIDAPYMPQFIGSAREKTTEVILTELQEKEQIKLVLVISYKYTKMQKY